MKIDQNCQRGNCCALKVLFNDVYITLILLGDPNWGESDLVSCVLYTKVVARLPLRYLGFLVV